MVSPLSFSCDNDRRETLVLYCRCEQYCIIFSSRNKSFPRNPFKFLHIRESLVSRHSRLDPRSSNVSSIEARGSSLEVRVSSVNLL